MLDFSRSTSSCSCPKRSCKYLKTKTRNHLSIETSASAPAPDGRGRGQTAARDPGASLLPVLHAQGVHVDDAGLAVAQHVVELHVEPARLLSEDVALRLHVLQLVRHRLHVVLRLLQLGEGGGSSQLSINMLPSNGSKGDTPT